MTSLDSETITNALRSGETERVNDVLDAVENAEPAKKAELLSACFQDCRKLYNETGDGYRRQSVVRFFAAVDPDLATAKARGNVEIGPDNIDLTEGVDDYQDALVEFYLTAIRDEDGRVRKSAERELSRFATRWEMLGERARIKALLSLLDDFAEDATGKKRETIVATRQEVQRHARSGGTGLRSAFQQFVNAREDNE